MIDAASSPEPKAQPGSARSHFPASRSKRIAPVTRLISAGFAPFTLADPGLLRLRQAALTLISASATAALTTPLAIRAGLPVTVAGLGVLFAMISALFVRERQPGASLLSLVIMYGITIVCWLAGTVLSGSHLASAAGFLVVFFAGLLFQACGPRAAGSALIGMVAYYLGVYLHFSTPHMLMSVAYSVAAPIFVWIAAQVIWPQRPSATLRHAARTLTLRARRLAEQAHKAEQASTGNKARDGSISTSARHALIHKMHHLHDAALALEDQLAYFGGAETMRLRAASMAIEFSAGTLLARWELRLPAVACLAGEARPEADVEIAGTLGGRTGRPSDLDAIVHLHAAADRMHRIVSVWQRQHGQRRQHRRRARYAASMQEVTRGGVRSTDTTAVETRMGAPVADATAIGSSKPAPHPALAWWQASRPLLCWLPALRGCVAALLAIGVGHSLSPERWLWAVVSVFVVLMGTRSRAETFQRSFQRLAGTVAGVFVSALLMPLIHGSLPLALSVMAICAAAWAYHIIHAYARGVFFITILVVTLYATLGFAVGPLLEIRMSEVLAGCVCAFAVAAVVFPLRSSRHIEQKWLAVMQALQACLASCTDPLPTSTLTASARPLQAMPATRPVSADPSALRYKRLRDLDRAAQTLRAALRPLEMQTVGWRPLPSREAGAMLAAIHATRVFCRAVDAHERAGIKAEIEASVDVGAPMIPPAAWQARARVDAIVAQLGGPRDARLAASLRARAASAGTSVTRNASAQALFSAADALNDSLTLLCQRLAAHDERFSAVRTAPAF